MVSSNATNTKKIDVKGKPKSGRVWKREGKRKSSMINVKALHPSWNKRQKDRAERQSVKQFQQELIDAANLEKEQKRMRQIEHKQRREENLKKSEIVQRISNPAKIKRMKKKQLRQIQKR